MYICLWLTLTRNCICRIELASRQKRGYKEPNEDINKRQEFNEKEPKTEEFNVDVRLLVNRCII